MTVLLTLTGFGITIFIFAIGLFNSNAKFKRRQDLSYAKFETETRLKLASFERELTELKKSIDNNKIEILAAYQAYKNETIQHTLEFRNETKHSLEDNKHEHSEIKVILGNVCEDIAYIRGIISISQPGKKPIIKKPVKT